MSDADREYLQALEDMAEQINLKCENDCDNCFQRALCEAVEGMRGYIEGRMKDARPKRTL